MSISADDTLDIAKIKVLINRAKEDMSDAKNRIRYSMNNFIIAAGSFVHELTSYSKTAGRQIGLVEVDMGGTSCKVPSIVE